MKQKALLAIQGERDVVIHPYLPEEFCPARGYLRGKVPQGLDCLIYIGDCEGSYIDSVSPSPTGYAYYETRPL